MKRHVIPVVVLVAAFSLLSLSCSTVQQLEKAMLNLQRCQFKLDGISDFNLGGIPLSGKTAISMEDGLKLLPMFQQQKFPASFNLNVAAINPNDSTGGTPRATATLTSLAWTLLIDSTTTIQGDIANPVTIPGTGQKVIIPLHMGLDLFQFFKDRGYENLLNLALALGGANPNTSRVMLRARPTIHTELGDITYPGEITIIDKEFRSQ